MMPKLPIVSLLFVAGFAGWGHGQAPDPPPASQPIPTLVLLLDTFRIVEAPCERVGEVYRLRIRDGIREIPASQVLFAGESRADVQRFLALQAGRSKPIPRSESGLNSAAYPLFAAKVQPILTNLCGRCHCDPSTAGGFVLERVPLGFADPDTTRRNARAAAQVVDLNDPGASLLLTQAIAAHGDLRDPPLPSRAHPAFRNLELWVHWAAAAEGSPAPGVLPRPGTKPASTRTVTPGQPRREAPRPEDPFNPDVFNQLDARVR